MSTHNIIKDDGALFQVVPATRKIVVPASHKIIGTVGDHNSEEITFQCPKTVDGHDVMNCAEHYVVFKNANGTSYRVDLVNEDITADDEYIYLTWVIDSRVTVSAGNVSFALYFVDKDTEGEVIYQWGTTVCSDCQVLESVLNDSPVEIPDGYVKPEGTLEITENGVYNVANFAATEVNVAGGFPTPVFVENDYGILDEGWYALAVTLPNKNSPYSLGTHYLGKFDSTMSLTTYGSTRILCDGWVFAIYPTMGCNVFRADGSGKTTQSFSEAGMKFYCAKLS